MGSKRKRLPSEPVELEITSLSHDGRGVARVEGKTVFVHGALVGEQVRARLTRRLRRHDEAVVVEVLRSSADRVEPRCSAFGVCGGCALQHMAPAAQIESKQRILAEVLDRLGGGLAPARWLEPLTGEHWGYRRKARLGVRWVAKKGRVLVGFRERGSSFVADIACCEVLASEVGSQLDALARLIERLSIRERLPQIEVAQGDGPVVLVFRVLDPPTPADCAQLRDFAAQTGLHVYLQEGGVESLRPLSGEATELSYGLPADSVGGGATHLCVANDAGGDHPEALADARPGDGAPVAGGAALLRDAIQIGFEPTDFTQVNLALNRRMVAQAVALLDPRREDAVLDLFCGVGNFSLPLAQRAGEVLGVEGDPGLVARAAANAKRNGLLNVRFRAADLYSEGGGEIGRERPFDLALLDPPRSGALEVLGWLEATGVRRILYVSCYPATLARDAQVLVTEHGFRLEAAGAMDMFPHTAHLEAMALFER